MDDEQTGTGLMDRLVAEVRTSMVSGASLGDVQDAVIDPAALDGDHKAALWLYAWSFERPARRRQRAIADVLMLKDGDSRPA